MKTIRIAIEGQDPQEFEAPSSWDECTDKQLTQIWNLQTRTDPGVFEVLLLMLHLIGIPPQLLDDAIKEYGEDADSLLYEMLDLLDFVKEPIRLKRSRMAKLFGWRGPNDRLRGMCLEQLGLAETAFRAFAKSKKESDLNLLVAILYRPFFIPWSNRFIWIELYQIMARLLPLYIKRRMFLNFRGVHEQFMADFPYVYKGKIKGTVSKHGWKATYLNLTETKFGNYRQTLKTEARMVMIYLDEQGKQVEENKPKTTGNGSMA